jgi:nucleoside-diphosphate-sugar epimerase
LLTGDRGRLGVPVRARLEADGHEVAGFDALDGHDVRDAAALREAAAGAEAIVHLAGLPDDLDAAPGDVMAVNVLGTFNVLLAARAAGASRVVYASSGKALGLLERPPAYLPVDDAHPGLPSRAYGLSKWLAEQACEAFTNETGIATICLRPVLVLDAAGWAALDGCDELPPGRGASWHLGVFVDADDVAEAVAASLTCPDPGHVRALLCADEVGSARAAADLVAEHLPGVRWRDGAAYTPGSRRALVDTTVAREVLGWRPRRSWG